MMAIRGPWNSIARELASNVRRIFPIRLTMLIGKILLIVLIVGGVFLALWFIPQWQVSSYRRNVTANYYWKLSENERAQLDRELLNAENNARVTLAQILGGMGLLAGLYFTWRTVKINEDGKITDRYSKAIELLGSDKLDVRLGGIYALERIATDSKKDHWTVMEALTAFVREHSPVKQARPEETQPITTDIQAALSVIGRRKWAEQEKKRGQYLNLIKADLRGANLILANLRGADLSGANLRGANLILANLRGADLSGADLSGANLREADLRTADLREADLYKANLSGADLSGANLRKADLREADLRGAKLDDQTRATIQDAITDVETKLAYRRSSQKRWRR